MVLNLVLKWTTTNLIRHDVPQLIAFTFIRVVNTIMFQGVAQERPAYSMRFAGPRSQTIQSMTSNSRSSPRLGQKHANGDPNALPSPSIEESSLS